MSYVKVVQIKRVQREYVSSKVPEKAIGIISELPDGNDDWGGAKARCCKCKRVLTSDQIDLAKVNVLQVEDHYCLDCRKVNGAKPVEFFDDGTYNENTDFLMV